MGFKRGDHICAMYSQHTEVMSDTDVAISNVAVGDSAAALSRAAKTGPIVRATSGLIQLILVARGHDPASVACALEMIGARRHDGGSGKSVPPSGANFLAHEVDHLYILVGVIGAGCGVGLVPAFLQRVRPRRVAFVSLRPEAHPLQTIAVWRRDHSSNEIRAFADVVRKSLLPAGQRSTLGKSEPRRNALTKPTDRSRRARQRRQS
jgi:hypothetical protein